MLRGVYFQRLAKLEGIYPVFQSRGGYIRFLKNLEDIFDFAKLKISFLIIRLSQLSKNLN